MKSPLVTIIMAAFNARKYIEEAITSVINQNYENWELIIVNDGSIDKTGDIIMTFNDQRIKSLSQENNGVSSARNLAIQVMQGEFLCFLDADDVLPPNSIRSRMKIFMSNPDIDYVDGVVIYTDKDLMPTGVIYQPSFEGKPMKNLLKLERRCLFGNTWMIRVHTNVNYWFDEDLSHSEDVYFYLTICHQQEGLYTYTKSPILLYRKGDITAMSNILALAKGYKLLLDKVRTNKMGTRRQIANLRWKLSKITFLSFLFDAKDLKSAITFPLKFWQS
ncbi:MAG: glycosyltransferase family 2 protein [Cyclobacteriaceae bacterium]